MMKRLTILAVLACVAAGAATKPQADGRALDVTSLRRQVDALATEVKALREEVDRLRAILAKVPGTAVEQAQADVIKEALQNRKIIQGMTVAQVNTVTGGGVNGGGRLLSQNEDGTKTYTWTVTNKLNVVDDGPSERFGSYDLICKFMDGKLVSFRKIDNHNQTQ